jgi:hypothetical protein
LAFAGFSLVNLGESNSSSPNLLKVDYTKSVGQVFQESAECLLQGKLGLGVLSLAGDTNTWGYDVAWRKEVGILSWVPDLTHNLKTAPFWTLGGDVFSAFQQGNTGGNFTLDGSTLDLQASQCNEIKMVGNSSREIALDPEGLLDILSILGSRYAPTGEATMTVLWRTFIANLHECRHPAPSFLSSSFLRWSIFVLFPNIGNISPKEPGKLTEIQTKTRTCLQSTTARSIISTRPFRTSISKNLPWSALMYQIRKISLAPQVGHSVAIKERPSMYLLGGRNLRVARKLLYCLPKHHGIEE